ncbi:hypothetical protein P8452_62758 [Trifolium repens]|nr:hypothetical protein P8452_62758 [Trifolium repens]
MEHGLSSAEKYEKFTWKIENFSRFIIGQEIYSEPFVLGGYPWRIRLFPSGDDIDNDYLPVYLEAVQMQTNNANMSNGWSRDVKFNLVVFNQLDSYMNITSTDEQKNYRFDASVTFWGFNSFMSLDELYDPNKGYIVNDVCIVGAEVFVCKSTNDEPVIHAANICSSPISESQTGDMVVEVPRKIPEVEGPVKDYTKDADAELVSAALGRVLYFLKTRKVKDMTEQACKHLQVLWDELKKFQFDLTWLEPHEKLAAAEVNLDEEIDLLKAKGFKEIGLDSELGCGSWRS